ncbi:Ankyrin repeat domain-containing protein [Balamuthia mandrillaris]
MVFHCYEKTNWFSMMVQHKEKERVLKVMLCLHRAKTMPLCWKYHQSISKAAQCFDQWSQQPRNGDKARRGSRASGGLPSLIDARRPADGNTGRHPVHVTLRHARRGCQNMQTLVLLFSTRRRRQAAFLHSFNSLFLCKHVEMVPAGYFLDQRSCTKAAALGSLSILQWLRCMWDCPWDYQTCEQAALHGHLHVLQWALEQGCPWSPHTFALAARRGHLEVLRWIRANQGQHACKEWCPDMNAALEGQWEVLKWLHFEVGCAWSGASVCSAIAAIGNLSMLQWVRDRGCPWDESTCSAAAGKGHLEVLQWAREQGCPWQESTCNKAAMNGHLHVLQWARAHGCPWNEDTCSEAALNGHLHVLQWARAQGCPWDMWTCARAAWNGHLDVVKWAQENRCTWDETTSANAAHSGCLDILQWVRENGCPWDHSTCYKAASNGHVEVLKWAWEQGCPHNAWNLLQAAHSGCLPVLKWAYNNSWPVRQEIPMAALLSGRLQIVRFLKETPTLWPHVKDKLCDTATARGHLHILRWAHEQEEDIPWSAATCAKAARGGHLAVLKWARQHGCEWDQQTCVDAAAAGHFGNTQVGGGERLSLQQGCVHQCHYKERPQQNNRLAEPSYLYVSFRETMNSFCSCYGTPVSQVLLCQCNCKNLSCK